METRYGRLFDLAPDGLGFIADDNSAQIWAFNYRTSARELAADVEAFVRMEGAKVRFQVDNGRVRSIERAGHASMAGGLN